MSVSGAEASVTQRHRAISHPYPWSTFVPVAQERRSGPLRPSICLMYPYADRQCCTDNYVPPFPKFRPARAIALSLFLGSLTPSNECKSSALHALHSNTFTCGIRASDWRTGATTRKEL